MKSKLYIKLGCVVLLALAFISCEEFLEIDVPEHKIVSETVFNEDGTAISAMTGIYNELFRAAYSGGWENSITVLSGLSSDNLKSLRPNDLLLREFSEHDIQTTNERNLSLWESTYKIIYMANSLLEGISESDGLTAEVKNSLEGEGKFVRAFTYFYLVNLYGEVPLVLTTDYRANSQASRNSSNEIYEQIITDLTDATEILGNDYRNNDRTSVNRSAAFALLARVHLYLGNWAEAELASTEVISNSNQYKLLDDLNQVFLANSQEAIWQLSPIGRGGPLGFTNEGSIFLFLSFAPSFTKVSLTDELVQTFEEEDLRRQNWIGFNETTGNYFPYKYKDRSSFREILEYSMVLRIAEQYLIRSEARLMQDNLDGAIADLDIIRERVGLPLISELNPLIDRDGLLSLVLEERRKELFAEWGHRWLDLKRLENASQVLGANNPNWESTDVLYPIPAQERVKNPNLGQNPGY